MSTHLYRKPQICREHRSHHHTRPQHQDSNHGLYLLPPTYLRDISLRDDQHVSRILTAIYVGLWTHNFRPTDEHYWLFGAVTAAVCVPFFVLIGSLNTTTGMQFWRAKTAALLRSIGSFLAWLFSCGGRREYPDGEDDGISEADSAEQRYRRQSAQTRDIRESRSRQLSRQRSMGRSMEHVVELGPKGVPAEAVRPELVRSESSMLAKMWLNERRRTLRYNSDV